LNNGTTPTPDQFVGRYPNPFLGINNFGTNGSNLLDLVDIGTSINDNLPIEHLLVPDRQVDVIIAFDSSGETPDNFPMAPP